MRCDKMGRDETRWAMVQNPDDTNELNEAFYYNKRRLLPYAFLLAFASARLSFSAEMTFSMSPRCWSITETPMCLQAGQRNR